MKVLYLSTSQIPSTKANSVHVMKMCQALQKEGIETELWCASFDKNNEEIYKKYNITVPFAIRKFYISPIVSKLIPMFLLLSLKCGMVLKRCKIQADYIIGRSKIAIYMNRKRFPFIYESHIPPRNYLLKKIEKKLITAPNFKCLIVISNALKKKYMELYPYLSESKIIVLHDATDLPDLSCCTQIELQRNGTLNIGYVGHLYPGKCMEVMIPIAKQCPSYVFHVVGGTPEWINYWKSKIKEQEIGNILFYGFVDNALVNSYYAKFDVAILPFSEKVYVGKKSEIATFFSPLKLFEAMGNKKAIVVSELPTIKEIVEDQKDCILCKSNDINAWIDALHLLEKDISFRNTLGENAYLKIAGNYTWIKRADKFRDILAELE